MHYFFIYLSLLLTFILLPLIMIKSITIFISHFAFSYVINSIIIPLLQIVEDKNFIFFKIFNLLILFNPNIS